jgi:uncharacterized protein YukE
MRPPEITVADHWSVAAEARDLAETSAVWGSVLSRHESLVQAWSSGARSLLGSRWSGAAAEAYAAHQTALEKDLLGCAALAGKVAAALKASADAVTTAGRALAGHFAVLSSVLDVRTTEGGVRFRPSSLSDVETMRVAVGQAYRVRSALQEVLDRQAKAIAATVGEWDRVAGTWRPSAEGQPTFSTPAEPLATLVLNTGDTVIISTGSGDDHVRVSVDPATGEQIVKAGSGVWRFPAGADLVVRTGTGDDTVVVAPGTHVRLTLIGGDGADALTGGAGDDVLVGLAGNDYLDGGAGADLMTAGAGDDAAYGLGGDDVIAGGTGRDVLNGGDGTDRLFGEDGADVLSGAAGADTETGGEGDDVIYTGSGADRVDGGAGDDTAYATKDAATKDAGATVERTVTVQVADLSKNIQIDGSPAFTERVQADLDLLRASPTGQRMLASLDQGLVDGDTLTIREFHENNGHAWPDVSAAQGMQRAIDYNPAFNTFLGDTPPVVVLYHEMAHQYDFVNGTMLAGPHTDPEYPDRIPLGDGRWDSVPNAERQAVGLPVDHDHDPSTPSRIDPSHPLAFTENGLRAELTWAQRAKYAQ